MISEVYARFENTSKETLCGISPGEQGDMLLRLIKKDELMLASHKGMEFVCFVMRGQEYRQQETEEVETEEVETEEVETEEVETEEVEFEDLEKLSKADLVLAVEKMGLSTDGTKKEILERVKSSL